LTEQTTTDCLLFPDIFDRPVVEKFDQRQGSFDGGAILLQAAATLRPDFGIGGLSPEMTDNPVRCSMSWVS
jgi:hypothetical protein